MTGMDKTDTLQDDDRVILLEVTVKNEPYTGQATKIAMALQAILPYGSDVRVAVPEEFATPTPQLAVGDGEKRKRIIADLDRIIDNRMPAIADRASSQDREGAETLAADLLEKLADYVTQATERSRKEGYKAGVAADRRTIEAITERAEVEGAIKRFQNLNFDLIGMCDAEMIKRMVTSHLARAQGDLRTLTTLETEHDGNKKIL